MEERLYAWVVALIDESADPVKRAVYTTGLILRVALWAILNDRPLSWACVAEHWPAVLRPRWLPDQSTLSRRLRRPQTRAAWDRLQTLVLTRLNGAPRYAAIDGRPLPVGGASQDRDARGGRAVGSMGRGYKLYAAADPRQAIVAFLIEPMNQAEPAVARRLLAMLPASIDRVVGDTIYDSMPLHTAAHARGLRLYTPLRKNRVGRRRQPRRLQLLRLWRTRAGRRLLKSRDVIERAFARLSGLGFGYKGLPPWIRGLPRVRLWISGKVLLYNAHLARLATAP